MQNKFCFSRNYHKGGIFLPFINDEEQKRKQKGVLFYRFALPKFNVKKDDIAPLMLKMKGFY